MSDKLSEAEQGVLAVFRALGVGGGIDVPESMLEYRFRQAGFFIAGSAFETALLGLEFRGLMRPGESALNARSWALTDAGVDAARGRGA